MGSGTLQAPRQGQGWQAPPPPLGPGTPAGCRRATCMRVREQLCGWMSSRMHGHRHTPVRPLVPCHLYLLISPDG